MGGIVMKYKVGDKVRVKSKQWYDKNKDTGGIVKVSKFFVEEMSEWCGKEVTIRAIFDDFYTLEEDKEVWNWTDEMFEDKTMEHKFKCKDEVIVRLKEPGCCWFYGEVSHSDDECVVLSGGFRHPYERYDVLPCEGNEHLVGTTDKPAEHITIKPDELVYVFNSMENFEKMVLALARVEFVSIHGLFCKETDSWKYCIPFSKFNPADLEATKKEILTVKNGKLVKSNVE